MPRFEPFRGLRYDTGRADLADVTAPPYDVVDDEERARLAARSPWNAVWVDLPVAEGDVDRYTMACRLLSTWREEGVLVADEQPSFYVYRMDYDDEHGKPRHTAGVIGALELSPPGEADVLPHEHTTPKAKSDRLEMLRSCRANLSPVWVLSLAKGLARLYAALDTDPLAEWRDDDGVQHRLWLIEDPNTVAEISATVGAAPVVIADGHHRYETSLAYRDQRRASDGEGPWDLAMAFAVELVEDELTVRPIHRLLSELPDDLDLAEALTPWFEVVEAGPIDAAEPEAIERVAGRMDDEGALALILPTRAWFLRPRSEALADAADLDSSRLDVALAGLPPHRLVFQHGTANVGRLVAKGEAQAGVLLRPATVAQIAESAHQRVRMPPKTTFFHPKVRTGLVFRTLD